MNQREIKFRAWNKTSKRMTFTGFGIAPNSDGLLTADDNVIVMQFTGLKDKNGKEIYEGDLIDTTNYKIDDRAVIWKVFWGRNEDEMLGWMARTRNGKYALDKSVAKGKVIGNIYENSELLNL